VVGQPGAGKSTLLGHLSKASKDVTWINTDDFSWSFRQMAEEHFGQDLVTVAIGRSQELANLVGAKWLIMLAESLKNTTPGKHVFVECAYGLVDDKRLYRFVGNKIVYVGCDEATQKQRVSKRGTPELMAFFDVIPGLKKTRSIAKRENLSLIEVDTGRNVEQIEEVCTDFLARIGG
jgi:dephospho-CoA kinase